MHMNKHLKRYPRTQLNTTAMSGVNLDRDKYEINFGKCPFCPAAYDNRAADSL